MCAIVTIIFQMFLCEWAFEQTFIVFTQLKLLLKCCSFHPGGRVLLLMLILGFYFNLWYRSGIDFCQHLLWCLYFLLHFIWLLTIVFIYAAFRLYWLVKLRLRLMSSLNSRRYVVWFENIKTKPKYNHCKLSIVHNINSVVLPFLNIN